ncbi:MAG: hypothetical protein EAZ47_08875 [Bacteroidetes bacterium]|nr:MAG: hypothetical protein EAY72_08770 [Bacteroidota bacterium]TAF92347.1 MAG: hypothetical protein EAZ47_08875 [Bacteroidota bacterium]
MLSGTNGLAVLGLLVTVSFVLAAASYLLEALPQEASMMQVKKVSHFSKVLGKAIELAFEESQRKWGENTNVQFSINVQQKSVRQSYC